MAQISGTMLYPTAEGGGAPEKAKADPSSFARICERISSWWARQGECNGRAREPGENSRTMTSAA